MKESILIVTNKEDITADFVVLELERRGRLFHRLNTEDFPGEMTATLEFYPHMRGALACPSQSALDIAHIRSVWFRRPRPPVFPSTLEPGLREFCYNETDRFMAGLYACVDAFWVSHPLRLHAAENKPYQLKCAHEIGFRIPRTLISNDPVAVKRFFDHCDRRVVAKPVRNGYISGDPPSAVYTTLLSDEDLDDLSGLELGPVIFQEFIPKHQDIRVTVIGSKVFSVSIDSQSHDESRVDWRRLQDPLPYHSLHGLPQGVEDLCVLLVRMLGLQFGAIDLVLSASGNYYFLEINPNGQWAWLEQEVGLPLTATLTDLLLRGEPDK